MMDDSAWLRTIIQLLKYARKGAYYLRGAVIAATSW